MHDLVELGARQGRRRAALRADEPGDARRVAHDRPVAVVHFHADEHVARQDLLLAFHPATALFDLGHGLGGNLYVNDAVLKAVHLDAGLKGLLHFVFIAGIGMDDVPLLRHVPYAPKPEMAITMGWITASSTATNTPKKTRAPSTTPVQRMTS